MEEEAGTRSLKDLGGFLAFQGVTIHQQKPFMARLRLFLLLLLALLPQPSSSLPWPDSTQGTMAGLILTALEKATLFLEDRLPNINLDGAVGFQVLEGM